MAAGSEQTPVRGSGVFVGGRGTDDGKAFGGTLRVTELTTGEIHTDGGIAPGHTRSHQRWSLRHQPITSCGPSGLGFVNFSDIGTLEERAPTQTFGKGARGFNLYDGSLGEAIFESIETHGDGSIGVQLSRPLPKLTIVKDLSTEGGEGLSLVKGVQMTLKAIALSIKPGGALDELHVGGSISTSGDDVVSVELADRVGSWDVRGGILAEGNGSDGVHYTGDGAAPTGVTVTAEQGNNMIEVPPAL